MKSHLVTLGGGGFSMEDRLDRSVLDSYVLGLTGKRRPKVCFLPTASGDSPVYIEKFLKAFPPRRAVASVMPLFSRSEPVERLLEQDVIYVGGGNTANLLAVWRLHGVDKVLLKAWKKGAVLAGISAGMNCWFSGCSTDSFGALAPLNDGLGLLPEAACPHFDGEAKRRPTLLKWVGSGKLPATYAADDFAAFHFVSDRRGRPTLERCIKARLSAGCYRVERGSGRSRMAVVRSLPTELLG
jgi:peptidase E